MKPGAVVPATGLAIAAAATLWWLAGTALLASADADAVQISRNLLDGLLVARLLAVAALGPSLGAGTRPGAAIRALAGLVALSWPLVLLATLAGGSRPAAALLAEAALLLAAAAAVGIGRALCGLLRIRGDDSTLAAAIGAVAAALLWSARESWLAWIPP